MKTISELMDQGFITLGFEYAKLYKSDARAFLKSYRKYDSIRSSCEMIVSAYKRNGAFDECKDAGVNFEEYANKHYTGRDARVLAEFLLILYNLLK